jgi:hypothetical protein
MLRLHSAAGVGRLRERCKNHSGVLPFSHKGIGEERNQSTSVNCSKSVRWIIEKLSSETMVSTVSPSGVT